jgi:hypothetical protein
MNRSESFTTRRSTLTLLLLAFLLGAVLITVRIVQIRQELRQHAQVAATLTLRPDKTTLNVGDEVNVDVVLNTGATQVIGTDVTVNFDTNFVTPVSFTTGNFFALQIVAPTITGNSARIVLGNNLTTPVTGEGVLAHLKLRATNQTSGTPVSFAATTVANGILSDGTTGYLQIALVPTTLTINQVSAGNDTVLSIIPASITVGVGDTFNLPVHIDTGSNQVSAVDLTVAYDQNQLEGLSVTNGGYLPVTTTAGTIGGGQAKIKVSATSGSYVQGVGVVAVLQFRAKQVSTSNVFVDPATTVTALNRTGNALKQSLSATVIVNGSQVVASPGTGGSCFASQPTPPTNVLATVVNSSNVLLFWNGVSNTTGYGIVYGVQSGVYIYGAANVGNVTSYTVGGLTAGRHYYFAVFAVNDCAPSNYSYEVNAVPTSGTGAVLYYPSATPVAYASPNPSFVPIDPNADPLAFLKTHPQVSPEDVAVSPEIIPLSPESTASPGAMSAMQLFIYNFLWVIVAILVLLIIIIVLYKRAQRE